MALIAAWLLGVLLLVDLLAEPVLLPVDLRFLGIGQLAAVGRAIARYFAVECALLVLQLGSLSGRQCSRLDALCDPVLLVLPALPDHAVAVLGMRRVVFVCVDLFAQAVLLLLDLRLFGGSQRATISLAVGADLLI